MWSRQDMAIEEFRTIVWDYYHDHGRSMPWRDDPSPYRVVVSELMLQQTQVDRVRIKFDQWMRTWPTVASLAQATPAEVITEWKGLGYNRRALWIRDIAIRTQEVFNGQIPDTPEQLITYTGIGPNTAGAILAYAYNQPVIYIETNIRRVFLHHFFPEAINVSDADILAYVELSLDRQNPREWYWALMDYGAYLARTVSNPNRRSSTHTVQKPFEGSHRQLRGRILELAIRDRHMDLPAVVQILATYSSDKVEQAVRELVREGFLVMNGKQLSLVEA